MDERVTPGDAAMNKPSAEQEAGTAVVEWVKQFYTPITTKQEEWALLPRVDLENITSRNDLWEAVLSIAGGHFHLHVSFWLDDLHLLQENRIHIEDVQEEAKSEANT